MESELPLRWHYKHLVLNMDEAECEARPCFTSPRLTPRLTLTLGVTHTSKDTSLTTSHPKGIFSLMHVCTFNLN